MIRASPSTIEVDWVWQGLVERWDARRFNWMIRVEDPRGSRMIHVEREPFRRAIDRDALQQVLRDLGGPRCFEVNQYSEMAEYDEDVAWVVPLASAETFWTPPGGEWLLHASHEATIVAAGEELVHFITTSWPRWTEAVYG